MLTSTELKRRQAKEKAINAKSAIVAMDIRSNGAMTIRQVRLRLKVLGLS